MRRSINILLFSVIISVNLIGETPTEQYLKENIQQRDFEKKAWEEAKAGIDFSRELQESPDQKDRSEEIRKDPFNSSSRNTYSDLDSSLLSDFMKFLLIAVVLVVLVVLIKSYLGLTGSSKSKNQSEEEATSKIDIETIEENIMDSDLASFIQKALDEQDYSLVIRLYYLAALKELSLKKMIKWKKDKTNRQYLQELKHSPFFDSFAEVTRLFEQIWYGANTLTLNQFNELVPQFQELVKNINHHQ